MALLKNENKLETRIEKKEKTPIFLTRHSHSWHFSSHFWPLWYSLMVIPMSSSKSWHFREEGEVGLLFSGLIWWLLLVWHWILEIVEQLLHIELELCSSLQEATPFWHLHSLHPWSYHWDPSTWETPFTTHSIKTRQE